MFVSPSKLRQLRPVTQFCAAGGQGYLANGAVCYKCAVALVLAHSGFSRTQMDISSMRSRPQTWALQKAKGICSVCHTSRHLHDKDGMVHLHGPRIKPCTGSHKPPANDDLSISTTDSMSHNRLTHRQRWYGPFMGHLIHKFPSI